MYGNRVSRSFKDISLSFEPHPITKDLPVLKNANAIRRSVRNLVQTIPGERFFNPILGSSVYDSLFDLMDFGTSNLIEQEIITTLRNFEPRVNNVRVRVSARADQNNFDVTIFFDIVGAALPPQEFSFILEATR
jgi:phage baseplate assembly protein W|tara:strand:+ start:263 stop:664 length:402 start_codon:yes stop_codon:yes gene_type:complete